MPVIQLEQGSKSWLEYRSRHIMATDTPVILGNNPWVTKLQRWKEKMGLEPPVFLNDAMKRGQDLEPIAREKTEGILGVKFTPIVYESDTNNWMAASLDGISECGRYIIEIKCPTNPKLHYANSFDGVPRYYRDQMDHQCMCPPGILANYFCTYFPEDKKEPLKITKFDWFDEEYEAVKFEIIDQGYEFYMQMCNFEAPVEWKLKERK